MIVVLIGMMGTGKTSVGAALASRLGGRFIDSDDEVEAAVGMSIADYFANHGEEAFRHAEESAIGRLLEQLPSSRDVASPEGTCEAGGTVVVATGGGAVLSARTRRALRDLASRSDVRVVWLRASIATLLDRTSAASRPLLVVDRERTLQTLDEERRPLYEECATVRAETDRRSIDEVVAEIEAELGTCGSKDA